jgi:hypothetical protein
VDRASAKIEDVKRARTLLIGSALGLVIPVFGWLGYRELSLGYVQRKYSHQLIPGMKRQVIEDRLLSERIRFFPESPDVDFVSVGDEPRYSLVCAPREVGLLLKFEVRDGVSSTADVLRSVKHVRQERGCM